MNPEPVNQSLARLATCLVQGDHPVIAELEPGDATYYNLLLVPAWAAYVAPHLGRFGIPLTKAHDYLIVTRLTDTEGQTFYCTRQIGDWDLEIIPNAWTRTVLVWWLKILWLHLEAQGA